MTKPPKRPRDANQLANMIVQIATGEATNETADQLQWKVRRSKGRRCAG